MGQTSSNNLVKTISKIVIVLLVSAICTFLLWFYQIWPPKFQLGQKSMVKLVNIEEQTILDEEATNQEKIKNKNQAINQFLQKPQFERDDSQNQESLQNLRRNISQMDQFFNEQNQADQQIRKTYPAGLQTLINNHNLTNLPQSSWLKVKKRIVKLARQILKYGYPGSINHQTLLSLLGFTYNQQELNLIHDLLELSLKPNLRIQFTDLQSWEKKVEAKTRIIWKTLPANTVILSPGETITQDKLSTIEQLGLNQREIHWKVFKEAFWMTLLVIVSFYLYVKLEKFQLSFPQIFLLCFLMIIASAFVGLFAYREPMLLPLAAVAMITALFFKPTVGLSAGILFGILSIQALGINATLALPAFIGGILGTLLSQKANNRADLARAGPWLGLGQILTLLLISVLFKNVSVGLTELMLQGLAGLLTALVVSSFMPYLESLFGVVTRFRLLELADPNQPLLQKLHEEAPGTYEHTLIVADLAQDAAKKVEADCELVRVGILYHDIGKLYNPQIFIENQFGKDNPHDKLTPQQSAKAIIAHVPEGLALAKKYKLPETISAFIPAHQGNSRAGHFFLKACQANPDLKDDSAFRYPGPQPHSKETGIAMLADTVEATIRSLKTSDLNLVRETIHNLIQARVQDGQLTDSNLSTEELGRIGESFIESWKNKNHERIKYIDDLKR